MTIDGEFTEVLQSTWKHKDWQTWPGTWLITAVWTDDEFIACIEANPAKYGDVADWTKTS